MRNVIDSAFIELLDMTWPTLFISIVLVVTIRIGYLLKHREEFVFYREVLYLCFMLYILCLFQLVTAEDINVLHGNNFQPFKEIFRYRIGGRLFFRNIVGNVLLLVPYGFFASLYVDLKGPLKAFILIFVASLSIEITQLSIGRIFDVDDIILNVLGGMIGFGLYRLFAVMSEKFTVLKKEYVLNILTTIILVGTVLLFIWR